ncbi:hypothetical protein TNIN_24681 [Trichonephila inaurata madagascariensis]|uniref:Uncharacterized protein n=1 Tax=Trichonephila inaurata madagascariensis TaxID=2747483 RepID=A0A8X6MGK0_9ARAC|nr:hypothetical protein TNIN_24681 [Trichonephila inaurata madagascariensis]
MQDAEKKNGGKCEKLPNPETQLCESPLRSVGLPRSPIQSRRKRNRRCFNPSFVPRTHCERPGESIRTPKGVSTPQKGAGNMCGPPFARVDSTSGRGNRLYQKILTPGGPVTAQSNRRRINEVGPWMEL